jgi:hypothetical protein
MSHEPNLLGIYKLPAPLLLAGDCLGHRIPLKIGKLTGEIVLPLADRAPQRIITLSPHAPDPRVVDWLGRKEPELAVDSVILGSRRVVGAG